MLRGATGARSAATAFALGYERPNGFPSGDMSQVAGGQDRIDQALRLAGRGSLADQVSSDDRSRGRLYPKPADVLDTAITTATRVAEAMFEGELARVKRPSDLRNWIENLAYAPEG